MGEGGEGSDCVWPSDRHVPNIYTHVHAHIICELDCASRIILLPLYRNGRNYIFNVLLAGKGWVVVEKLEDQHDTPEYRAFQRKCQAEAHMYISQSANQAGFDALVESFINDHWLPVWNSITAILCACV